MGRGGWTEREGFFQQVEPRVLIENTKRETASPVRAN